MNSSTRKYEESEAIVCLSAGVSEESILTIASVASLSRSIYADEEREREREERGGGAKPKISDHRGAREGWSRIELRILDSKSATKGVYQSKDSAQRSSLQMNHWDAESAGVLTTAAPCPTAAPEGGFTDTEGRPAAEGLLKTGSLWTDREGSANQGPLRPVCSCSGLFLYPRSSVYSVYSVLLLEPKLLLFHGVSFQRLVFCLVKKSRAT